MKTKNSVSYSLIGGIIFSVLTLFQLITLIRFFSFAAVLLLAGYAVTATALFMEKRDFLPIVGIGLLAFSKLISFFQGFSTVTYRVRTYSYFSGVFEHFNLFAILPALVTLTAYGFLLFLAVCTFTDCLPKQKTFVKNIWFLPAALTAVSFAGGLLIYALISVFSGGIWMGCIAYHSFFNILQTLLLTAGLLMTGMWLAYPQAEQSPFSYDTSSDTSGIADSGCRQNQTPYEYGTGAPIHMQDGYCDLVKHILLLLFTFGIWYFIWIYRTTRYLNRVEGEEYRNPTYKLLLCMFVPFYLIYWVYQSARRIDRLAASRGVSSDLTVLCLILAIFVGIIPPMLMQEKLNAIIDIETGGAGRQPSFHQTPSSPAGFQQMSDTSGSFTGFAHASKETTAQAQTASGSPDFRQTPDSATDSQPTPQKESADSPAPKSSLDIAEELKIYKELLDSEIITQEEFDAKKKQLLNL